MTDIKKNCGPFYPEMTQKHFQSLYVTFYKYNYDVITKAPMMSLKKNHTHSPWGVLCGKFQFSPWCSFTCLGPKCSAECLRAKVQSVSVFPTRLPHHVTYDILILIKTFHWSRRTNDANFVSIWQAVAEKNTKVLFEQTNMDPNTIPSPLVSVTGRALGGARTSAM